MSTKFVWLLLNTKPFLALLVAVAVIGSSFGIVLALPTGQNQEGMPPMSRVEQDELSKQFHEQPEWGFISRYGRTGRIQTIDVESKPVVVRTPKGHLQARAADNTAIRQHKINGKDLTFEDLTTDQLVTVNGERDGDGAIYASEIGVIDGSYDGESGFNIRPYSGQGPA
jgi:hypothetical protein